MLTLNDKIMKIITQVFCTNMPSMAVKDTKETYLRPITFPLFVFRFQNVEYDRDSVFIVLSYDTLIGICSVCFHNSTFFI